ncbi:MULTISPECIES: hypothetical protein [unclassified Phormidesmis]
MLNFDLSEAGNWRLIYYQQHVGDKSKSKIRAPMIDIIELPITIASRVLAVGASYLDAPPSWNTAGYFYQEVGGVSLDDTLIFPGLSGSSSSVLDGAKRRITLNTIELHIFPRLATEHRYRFEAMRWMPKITLGVWEYIGAESDTTEELLQALRVDLARIEMRINNLQ